MRTIGPCNLYELQGLFLLNVAPLRGAGRLRGIGLTIAADRDAALAMAY